MDTLRNSVQLIGYLGANPEVKTLESGAKVATMRVATTDRFKTKSGSWKEETQWHTVNGWSALAERIEKQLQKGSLVAVEGRLTYREYVDGNGTKRYFTEIKANSLIALDKKATAEGVVVLNEDTATDNGLPF